jgi:hypothetical protein
MGKPVVVMIVAWNKITKKCAIIRHFGRCYGVLSAESETLGVR